MDRKAIVQGLYKKLKIREIATLSKCGLATVQRTKNYLQDHNIPFEEAIELTITLAVSFVPHYFKTALFMRFLVLVPTIL